MHLHPLLRILTKTSTRVLVKNGGDIVGPMVAARTMGAAATIKQRDTKTMQHSGTVWVEAVRIVLAEIREKQDLFYILIYYKIK